MKTKCGVTGCDDEAIVYAAKTKVCGKHKQRYVRHGNFRARKYGVPKRTSLNDAALEELRRINKNGERGLGRDSMQTQKLHALLRRAWVRVVGDRVVLSVVGTTALRQAREG